MTDDKKSDALARVTMAEGGVQLQNMNDAQAYCKVYFDSGLAPDHYKSPSQIFVAVQKGAELGMKPAQSLDAFYVVRKTPALYGKAVLALIRNAGHKVTVGTVGEGDDRIGWAEYVRTDTGETGRVEFSMKEAKAARLHLNAKTGKDNVVYTRYPSDMLIWRAVHRLGDRYFSDVTLGLPVAEVVREMPSEVVGAGTYMSEPPEPDPLLADLDHGEPTDEEREAIRLQEIEDAKNDGHNL